MTALQRDLLTTALDSLRPGGIAGYVVCSPLVQETSTIVTAVLAGRDDVRILDAPALLAVSAPALRAAVPGLRCPPPHGSFAQFWPHRHGTDAIFVALLERTQR